jgi:putative hydrolase of the HAD superfamily
VLRFSPNADKEPKAICLDLFGTIVFFDSSRLPRQVVQGQSRVVTMPGIENVLAEVAPQTLLPAFLDSVAAAGAAIAAEKQEHGREIPTRERFRRALVASKADGAIDLAAEWMAERHMASLSDAVVCPADRPALLRELAARCPIALVSNFDDGPTARRLLERFGLTSAFRSIRVSAEVGVIKPSATIFLAACEDLGAAPSDTLHVGDSVSADIRGAAAAAMRSLWVGEGPCDVATGTIADLSEVPRWLSDRYG